MSFISITAPVFTEEDERAERESMSPEEIEEVQNDINGINTFEATPEMVQHGPHDLQLALDDIHEEEKEVYLEAMMLCPELVDRESNYLMFLRSESYNVWAAAERLLKYWEFRKWLFGERFSLPMTLTGNGALEEVDIALLRTAPVAFLHDDKHGRGVIYADRSRVKPKERRSMMRASFYILTVMMESETIQKNGVVLVANTKKYQPDTVDRKFYRFVSFVSQGYHPVNIKAMHVCAPAGKSLYNLIMPFAKYVLNRAYRRRFLFHSGTNSELMIDLGDYGIKAEHIPIEMGGSFPLEERFPEWLEKRLQIELLLEKQDAIARETIVRDRDRMKREMLEREMMQGETPEGSEAPANPNAEQETGIPCDTA